MDFLEASRELVRLTEELRGLAATWTFRYSLIVQASDRGLECPHARRAMRAALEDQENVTLLAAMERCRVRIATISHYLTGESGFVRDVSREIARTNEEQNL